MRIEFEKKSENRKYSFIVHLVEHEGYGTLHKLVYPLQVEEMQKVFFTHDMSVFKFNTVDSYILHVTGHMYPIVSNLELLSQNGIKYFLFLHVAPNYYLFKKEKLLFMDYLEYIQKKYGIRFFCPSENVANQYKRNGIDVECIQIGIEKIEKQTELLRLEPYYNKYVTVCTSSDFRYIALKGIDIFVNQMERIGQKENSLILGFDGEYMGVKCRQLSYEDFLNVLSHSKSYIQFSRTEAYNLTAVQAKQLRVPVLVSNIDGHVDCMKLEVNLYMSGDDFASKLVDIQAKEIINENFIDSIERENTNNFVKSITTSVGG